MMALYSYVGQTVKIIDDTGRTFVGTVDDHFDAEDNETGIESIVIQTAAGDFIEFGAQEIAEVFVI